MNNIHLATILVSAAQESGGCTVDAEGLEVSGGGFVVGGKVPSHVMTDRWQDLVSWLQSNPSDYYGSWKDSETSLIHFDAVDFVRNREDAIRLGLTRGEIAIWDAAAGEEIRLADYFREGISDDEGPDPFEGHYDESGY